MPTTTRKGSPKPADEQPADPADEAQAERTEIPDATPDVEHPADPSTPAGDEQLVAQLQARVDRTESSIERIAQLLAEAAEAGPRPVDLAEVHDRFDVLAQQIDDVTAFATPRSSAAPGVYAKVLDLTRRVIEIGKGGTAPREMGGYAFRRVDDAIDAVGNALRTVGLILRSEVVEVHAESRKVSGRQGPRDGQGVRVTMRYVFVDPDDGSEHSIEGVGEGADAGDKATSKAASMALKYALLQGLMIPVVGQHLDVESEDTRPNDEPPRSQDRGGAPVRSQRDPNGSTEGRPRGRSRDVDGPDYDATAADRLAEQPARQLTADQRIAGDVDAPAEIRAEAVLRMANDGRDLAGVDTLLQHARAQQLASAEVVWHGERATLQQHLVGLIRVLRGGQR